MATFPGVLQSVSILVGNIDGRITRIPVINPRDGSADGTFHVGTVEVAAAAVWAPASPPAIVPASYSGAATPSLVQPDWPDFKAETRAFTIWRDSTMSLPRLKDRLYGQSAQPLFTCSSLVFGLEYKLTVNLEEGPIGGPFTAYTPLERIYTAISASMDIPLYLPTPNEGREIRVTTVQNVRYYGA